MAHIDDQEGGETSASHIHSTYDDERGGRKRSRSPSTPPPSQQRKSQRTQDSPSTFPLQRCSRSPHASPEQRARRRSEHAVDETFRGRTRQRSWSKRRQSSAISEEDELEPPSRDPRRRSPSPSRGPGQEQGTSPPFRRRRSLPNHYERSHVSQHASKDASTSSDNGLESPGEVGEQVRRDDRAKRIVSQKKRVGGEMDIDNTQGNEFHGASVVSREPT